MQFNPLFIWLNQQPFSTVCTLTGRRNDVMMFKSMQSFEHFVVISMVDKSTNHGKLLSTFVFTITLTVLTSISVEVSLKFARSIKRRTNCATSTTFPQAALLPNIALEKQAQEFRSVMVEIIILSVRECMRSFYIFLGGYWEKRMCLLELKPELQVCMTRVTCSNSRSQLWKTSTSGSQYTLKLLSFSSV